MSSSTLKPRVRLFCALSTGSEFPSTAASAECLQVREALEPYQRASDLVYESACEERSGNVPLIGARDNDSVAVVHLVGEEPIWDAWFFPGAEGLDRVETDVLIRRLLGFPSLQLVILSRVAQSDLVRGLLLGGVPAVLCIDTASQMKGMALAFYRQLLEGRNIRQSFFLAQDELGLQLPFFEASYNPETEELDWGGAEPPLSCGLFMRARQSQALLWRLRYPHISDTRSRMSAPAPEKGKPARSRERSREKRPAPASAPTLAEAPPVRETPAAPKPLPAAPPPAQAPEPAPAPARAEAPPVRETPAPPPPRPAAPPPAARPQRPASPAPAPLAPKVKRQRPQRRPLPSGPSPLLRWAKKSWRPLLASIAALCFFALLLSPSLRRMVVRRASDFIYQAETCPFPERDGNYHVLLLPFFQLPDCQETGSEFRRMLMARMQELATEEGLPLRARYHSPAECASLAGGLRDLCNSCQADMVLWSTAAAQDPFRLQVFLPAESGEQSYMSLIQNELQSEASLNPASSEAMAAHVANLVRWAVGIRAFQDGRYTVAIKALERVGKEKPETEALVMSVLMQCYVRGGQPEKAQAYYDQRLRDEPQNPAAYVERARFWQELSDWPQALADYRSALALDSLSMDALLGRGEVHSQMGKYELALADFERALRLSPDFSPAYFRRSQLYGKIGDTQRALADLDQALNYSPTYYEAWLERGQLQLRMKQPSAAEQDASRARVLRPDRIEWMLLLADIRASQAAWPEALDLLTQALARRQSAEIYFRRSELHRLAGEAERAASDLAAAIEYQPSYAPARLAQAQGFEQAGKWAEAVAEYQFLTEAYPQEASYWRRLGAAALNEGRTEQAKESLSEALRRDSADAEAWYLRAKCLLQLGQAEAALADASMSVQLFPARAESWYFRGRIHLDTGNDEAGRQDLEKALRLDPSLSEAYVQRARLYQRKGQAEAALRDLDRAAQLGVASPEAYVLRAALLTSGRDYAAAARAYEEAVRMAPASPEVLLAQAAFLAAHGDPAAAYEGLKKGLDSKPDAQVSYFLLRADLERRLGKYAEAFEDYSRGLRAYPDSAGLLVSRGLVSLEMNNLSPAGEDFDEALRLRPRMPGALFGKGELMRRQGQPEQALAFYDQALAADPRQAAAFNRRGEILFKLEAFDKALADFNQALALDPRFAPAYHNRGRMSRKAGDFARALKDFSQAIAMDAYYAEAYFDRAFVYSVQNQTSLAIADLERAIGIQPENGLYHGALAKLYAKTANEEAFYRHLALAVQHGYPRIELESDPVFKPYQSQSRYQEITRLYQQ
jgi:tetratricopeptide (TPR) repeat protein